MAYKKRTPKPIPIIRPSRHAYCLQCDSPRRWRLSICATGRCFWRCALCGEHADIAAPFRIVLPSLQRDALKQLEERPGAYVRPIYPTWRTFDALVRLGLAWPLRAGAERLYCLRAKLPRPAPQPTGKHR